MSRFYQNHVPFSSPNQSFPLTSSRRDEFCQNAAIFLGSTEELTLEFGDKYKSEHPWYNLNDEFWNQHREEWPYGAARLRPNVCESGLVIDWILSYAWHNQYLQHIPKVRLTGDVQEWVKQKWHRIFEQQAQHNRVCKVNNTVPDPFFIFKPDLRAIERHGTFIIPVPLQPFPLSLLNLIHTVLTASTR